MSKHECPNENENCKYYPNCYADRHHEYWPRDQYTSKIERRFRMAFVELTCRALHDEIHASAPPEKPSLQTMREVIGEMVVEASYE